MCVLKFLMARLEEINERMSGMNIDDEENEQIILDEGVEEDSNKFELCLVGRFITEKGINTRAMKSKLADVWKPARGINIKDLKPGIFLFQFYHADDMAWVVNGGPWSFDGALLVHNFIPKGEDPVKVPLFDVNFWIQIHGLPSGLMNETVGKQLGNFFGTFLLYDPNNNTSIWRESMRLRIRMDVRKPLKRKKKICKRDGTECVVQCKYERLGDFCFVCGLLSHTERFCSKKLGVQQHDSLREWGSWLRAPPRRAAGQERSKWLRDERDEDWGGNLGSDNYQQQFSEGQGSGKDREILQRRDYRNNMHVGAKFLGSNMLVENSKVEAANLKSNNSIGPSEDELIGLTVEEKKRKRNGPIQDVAMLTDGNIVSINPEVVLSNMDCSTSSSTLLAKSAQQTSQSL